MTEPTTKKPRKKRWNIDDGGDKEEAKTRLWAIANKLSVKLGFEPVDPATVPKATLPPLSCVLNPFSGLPLYPSSGLVAGQRKQRKIFVPTGPLPAGKGFAGDTNYLGLLIGPRGATQKNMEQESGAKILIRGRGSSKDGNDASETEDLHVLIMGDTDAQVDKAAEMVEDLLFNVDKREKVKVDQLHQLSELSGDPRTPSVLPPDTTVTKEIFIPQDRVGLVIGKGGETIKQLQISTGCHIQIARENGADNMRGVTLGGTQEQISRAEVEVYYVIDKEGRFTPPSVLAYAASAGAGGSSAVGVVRAGIGFDGKDDMTINIPQNMVGLLIGKGGETIRQLQERTGAHIQVTKDTENDPQSGARVVKVRLGGTKQQLDNVRKEIDALIEVRGNPGTVGADGSRTESVYVPGAHVGVVIGRGGETIKRLQAQTGARIQVSKDDSGTEREIIISGSDRQLEFARSEINVLIADAVRRDEMRAPVIPRGTSNYGPAGQPTTMSQKLQQIAQEKQAAMAAAYENMETLDPAASGTTDMYGYYYGATEYFGFPGYGATGTTTSTTTTSTEGKEGATPGASTQASWTPEQIAAYYAYYGYTYPVAGATDTTTTSTTTDTSTTTGSSSASTSIATNSPDDTPAPPPPVPPPPAGEPLHPAPPPVPAPPPTPPPPQGLPPLPATMNPAVAPSTSTDGSPVTLHCSDAQS